MSISYLDLLNKFRPHKVYKRSAFIGILSFLIFVFFWFLVIYGATATVTFLVAGVLPKVLTNLGFVKAAEIMSFLGPIILVLILIPTNALFLVLNERKLLALLTVRYGPNRVGPDGFLQTIADAVKLLFKEDIMPKNADKMLFNLAPVIFFAPGIVAFIPLLAVATGNTGPFATCDLSIGILFILAASSIPVIGLVLGGWASSNKYSLIGGFRGAAQAISYEIPMVLTIISVILFTGSINLTEINNNQAGGLLNWNIFGFGGLHFLQSLFLAGKNSLVVGLYGLSLLLISFILLCIYLISAFAEVNRIPFDLPEADSELVSGYNTEFTGMKFALFFLAEYTALFIICLLAVILFLGGGHLPISIETEKSILELLSSISIFGETANLSWILPSITLMLKAYVLVFIAVWIRATLPRLRYDQLLTFSWKFLIPLSLINIFIVAILVNIKF